MHVTARRIATANCKTHRIEHSYNIFYRSYVTINLKNDWNIKLKSDRVQYHC